MADALNNGYNDGYDDAGYNKEYDNGYYSYDNDYNYDDNGHYNNNGYHSNSHHNNGYNTNGLNKIVEELETDLQLLWDTFLSLSINYTFVGHPLDQVLCTTTSPRPFCFDVVCTHIKDCHTLIHPIT